MKTSNDIMYDVPLPDSKLEKGKFVATLRYQIPRRIILHGRRKTSPKFDTLYGLIYWLNKQPYHLEYAIFRSDKDIMIRQGFKRAGETIV